MSVTIDGRRDIGLAAVERVAWHGEGVALAQAAVERMQASREGFLRLLEHPDVVIYGVTSGYGQMAHVRLDADERLRHARRPPHANQVTFGEAFPERVTRAIVLARLANYVDGHAAITPALAVDVAAMLNGDVLPRVPLEGHGGAGEILILGELFGPLAQRAEPREKDVLALINGSPGAAALVADAALVGRRRLALIEEVFALAYEAFQAPLEHIDPVLAELWNDADEADAVNALARLLAGADGTRRPYQAPVSFRILPRLLGRLRRAVRQAEAAAERSLQSVTDNPMYIPPSREHPDGRVLSNGGFHNTLASPALDELAAIYADLCTLADRQTAKLLNGAVSRLPDQLRADGDDPRYMGCLPMVQVGLGEAARRAAQRTFLPGSESGGFGQNDVATNAVTAWRAQAEAGRLLEGTLAPLALVASQALHVTGRDAPSALKERLAGVRSAAPVLDPDMRPLGPDAGQLAERFRTEILDGSPS